MYNVKYGQAVNTFPFNFETNSCRKVLMGLKAGLKESLSSSILIYSEYFFKVLYFNAYLLCERTFDGKL